MEAVKSDLNLELLLLHTYLLFPITVDLDAMMDESAEPVLGLRWLKSSEQHA